MSKIKTSLSIIFHSIYIWGCVSSAYPILLSWSWECVLYLITIIKLEIWIINHCLGLGHEAMLWAFWLTMFLLKFISDYLFLFQVSCVQCQACPHQHLDVSIWVHCWGYLTHLPLNKWLPLLQTTFSNAFSWMKITEFGLKFHWIFFPGVQLTISQHWFRQWLGAEQATSHCLSQYLPSSLTHICSTRGRWVNSLLTPYGIGPHWFRSCLVAWQYRTIVWTSVDLSSGKSSYIHLRAISGEIP